MCVSTYMHVCVLYMYICMHVCVTVCDIFVRVCVCVYGVAQIPTGDVHRVPTVPW